MIPAPKWLLDLVTSRETTHQPAAPIPSLIPVGERHAVLLSLAGSARRRGAEPPEIEALLTVANERRCEAPLPPDEIATLARSMARYAPSPNGEPADAAITAARALVESLPAKTTEDPGAPYEPDAVRALRLLNRHAPGEYERARKALKKAGARLRRLDRAIRGAEPRKAPSGREILIRPQIREVVDEAEDALLAAGAELYSRAGQLVRVVSCDEQAPSWLHRPAQHPIIEAVPEAALREAMAAAAVWLQPRTDDDPCEALPPGWAAQTLAARGRWKVPALAGVALAPCLRPDGSILATQGYDPSTGVYLVHGMDARDPLEETPSAALAVLTDAVADFPFVSSVDLSAALAAMLTLAARPAIDGPCPLFAVSSPTPGTGKSLLCEAIAIAMTGRGLARMQPGRTDEEDDKRILAIASEGLPAILLDNLEHPLGSAPLAAALTATVYRGRVLGSSRTIEVPVTAVWFASGNNLEYRGDTYRRVIPISLDAACESPEERSGWRHDPLIPWLRREHPRLVRAALFCLRAWLDAGLPRQPLPPYGSYEAWSDLVRQCLVWLDLPDPCAGRAEIRATCDRDAERRRALFSAWHQATDRPITVAELIRMSADDANLQDALVACSRKPGDRPDSRAVGRCLAAWRGRIEAGLRLDRSQGHPPAWQVSTQAKPPPDPQTRLEI